jgi:hypothetical protein
MPHAVILYLDQKSENKINDLWKNLADEKLSESITMAGIRPHITLAIYDELACQPCDNELDRISSRTTSIPLRFSYLGFFTKSEPVIFAAPNPTNELLAFHDHLHTRLANESKGSWEHYKPGSWVPHFSLAMDFKFENIGKIILRCQTLLPLPMDVSAIQLGVVEFQPIRDIFKYDFLTLDDENNSGC